MRNLHERTWASLDLNVVQERCVLHVKLNPKCLAWPHDTNRTTPMSTHTHKQAGILRRHGAGQGAGAVPMLCRGRGGGAPPL